MRIERPVSIQRSAYYAGLYPLRASAGLGLSWISPVGPLKLSYGTPIKVRRNDRIQRFQFQIGTAF